MTKNLSDVLPEYTQLKEGMELSISSVSFDKQTFDGDEVDRVIITDGDGKKYTTTSKVIIGKLQTQEIQEYLQTKDHEPIKVKVLSTKSKKGNRTYLDLE